MDYTNSINGCSLSTTTVVPLNITPPSTVALAPVTIPCGGTVATITAGTTTTSTTYTYQWSGESATSIPVSFGNQNANTTTVFQPGTYDVVITNTVNGCSTTNSILVNAGVISAGINPPLTEGFSPLSVTLGNTTPVSSSSGTITTTWNYGNGTSVTTSSLASTYTASGLPSGSTVYQTAGSYTVLLMVSLNTGTTTCVGTATALVNVELPSDLTVPNVFTPNGDGVNDNFTLLTTNLSEITCTIFDRWGTKMYDVNADKGQGNISWDGKNLGGKEVPAGTYFYILKAKGADGKDYEQKGTISLYR
jgi:gliding motility-associated-like protein